MISRLQWIIILILILAKGMKFTLNENEVVTSLIDGIIDDEFQGRWCLHGLSTLIGWCLHGLSTLRGCEWIDDVMFW